MRFPDQIELSESDARHVVQLLPRDIRQLLTEQSGRLFVGGGFIREVVAGGSPVDIDLFVDTKERADVVANDIIRLRGGDKSGTRKHVSKNAITLVTPNRLPVQIITRWTFTRGCDLVRSFDFTVCQAVLWRGGSKTNSKWETLVHRDFYRDLAGRNLIYTNPVREEEAGGSMMRVLKFIRRGYRIQVASLGEVMARVFDKIERRENHVSTGQVVSGLLREVDPLMVIDGFDVEDEHEPLPEQEG